jgi:hypothetical protein
LAATKATPFVFSVSLNLYHGALSFSVTSVFKPY